MSYKSRERKRRAKAGLPGKGMTPTSAPKTPEENRRRIAADAALRDKKGQW